MSNKKKKQHHEVIKYDLKKGENMCNEEQIVPIELSGDNQTQAVDLFNECLNSKEFVYMVVFGEGDKTNVVLSAANELINDPWCFYKAIRVIWAHNPAFIIPKLKELTVDYPPSEIDWDDFNNIALIALSRIEKVITEIIEMKSVDNKIKARISAAAILALGFH